MKIIRFVIMLFRCLCTQRLAPSSPETLEQAQAIFVQATGIGCNGPCSTNDEELVHKVVIPLYNKLGLPIVVQGEIAYYLRKRGISPTFVISQHRQYREDGSLKYLDTSEVVSQACDGFLDPNGLNNVIVVAHHLLEVRAAWTMAAKNKNVIVPAIPKIRLDRRSKQGKTRWPVVFVAYDRLARVWQLLHGTI